MEERIELRRRDNELLTRTGADTEMGQLLRRYWQPVALSRHLKSDDRPQALRILGEDLVLFRDSRGRPGLIGRHCSHRRADLAYGRVEHDGIRCLYHGWLYDVEGHCLQQPAESDATQTCAQIKHLAYPCHEAGGAVWAYFGPGDAPEFPTYPPFTAPETHVFAERWYTKCNYLQGNEGNLDPCHTSYLHGVVREGEKAPWDEAFEGFQVDPAPDLSVEDTSFGVRIYAERETRDENKKMLRVSNFIMPNAAAANGFETGFGRGGCAMVWHVPIDDLQHYRFEFTFHCKVSLEEGLGEIENIFAQEFTPDGQMKRRTADGFAQDREEMKKTTFSGLGTCFPAHDIFIVESQGEIHDRSLENLGHSDIAIVRARMQLREGLQDISAGRDPRGVIRKAEDNVMADFLVLTETLDKDTDSRAFCHALAQEDIYRLDRAS